MNNDKRKIVTADEILALMEDPDEMDQGFAELIELMQSGAPLTDRLDRVDSIEAFHEQLYPAMATILAEDGQDVTVLEVEFVDGNFSGIYQSGDKQYRFLLSENANQWSKRIKPL